MKMLTPFHPDLNMFINGITFGDAKLLLPTLPDKCVDTVLTDPPYDLDRFEQEWYQQEFKRLSKGWIIVFGSPENQWCGGDERLDQYLFWIKSTSNKNTSKSYSRFVEMIFVYQQAGATWNKHRYWSQYTNIFNDLVDTAKGHPFRKPPALIKRLILNHTVDGEIILDPFAGTNIIGEIASDFGRKYIAFEKELS